MNKNKRWYTLIFLFGLILGCAPVISLELKEKVDSSVAFKKVQEDPNVYAGKIVLWGGDILQTLPQEDGTALIEVLKWPLGWWDEPRETVAFQGRFLVLVKGHPNPSHYKRGKRITVAGEIQGGIQGSKIKALTDETYQYPVILSKELHVWEYSLYSYSSAPDYRETWEYRHYEGILRY
jgi:outer membrane lipoprotein